ncbi:hypothetical protein [Actinomadura sp. SCN-SB]|uniref:hypothetical protein n=1 Tax=Actinomadura sp. SCN-SB TaxID=3373092 RepID=UPI003750012B
MGIDGLRVLSSTVFGHRYRLELLAALSCARDGEGVCLKFLADKCGAPSSVYYPSLKSLLSAGLIARFARTKRNRWVLYGRKPSPVWTGVQVMMEDLEVEIDFRDVVRAWPEAS